jgi:hypothetical protein
VPAAPAACAGPRGSLDEVRPEQWAFTARRLADDPNAEVWLAFGRTLSPKETGDAFGSLTAHGVQVIYEQRQGTYVKAQDRFPAVPVDDPAVERAARQAIGPALAMINPLPIGDPHGLEPADDQIGITQIPIGGLLVSGNVAAAIRENKCLVYGLTIRDGDFPPISPAIEPQIDPQGQPCGRTPDECQAG